MRRLRATVLLVGSAGRRSRRSALIVVVRGLRLTSRALGSASVFTAHRSAPQARPVVPSVEEPPRAVDAGRDVRAATKTITARAVNSASRITRCTCRAYAGSRTGRRGRAGHWRRASESGSVPAVTFWGVASRLVDEAIELYPTREQAEATLEQILRDEPNWSGNVYVTRVDLAVG